jgi:hypothetical protein
MANHLTDVAWSDQHTVKPRADIEARFCSSRGGPLWREGFPLIGGRLDLTEHRLLLVSALQYRPPRP